MERLYIIAPALIPSAYMLSMFAYFVVRTAQGKQPAVEGLNRRKFSDFIGPFLTAYFLWVINPIERALKGRVPPNAVTGASLAACAAGGVALATGYLATAAWAYILAGAMDVLDGRLARATDCSSKAGAFLDSVSDRWGELFIFAGAAWYLRDTPWLGAVMLAVAGSMMVSYTRARGEGLGLNLDGGTMQRAERVFIMVIGMLIAAWLGSAANTAQYSDIVIGATLLITGVGSTATSLHRWWSGYSQLKVRDATASDQAVSALQPTDKAEAAPTGDTSDGAASVVIPFGIEASPAIPTTDENPGAGSEQGAEPLRQALAVGSSETGKPLPPGRQLPPLAR